MPLKQKRAAQITLDITDVMYPSRNLFKTLNWMNIQDRFQYRTVTMVLLALDRVK